MTKELINKYRPQSLEEVLGQDETKASLEKVLKSRSAHSFIFTGSAGLGKTTLARIIAMSVDCHENDLMEINAAVRNGIDDMREIVNTLSFAPIFGKSRVVIMDEVHALSKAAWNALLKSVEEPPAHVFWVFCTTEATKIPETVWTRCARFSLRPVAENTLFKFLVSIDAREKFNTHGKVLDLISRKSQGSPRRALSFLAACAGLRKKAPALKLLREAEEADDAVYALCQALIQGRDYPTVIKILDRLEETAPESIRINVFNWFSGAARRAKTRKAAERACTMMTAFETPYPTQAPLGCLVLSIARATLGG